MEKISRIGLKGLKAALLAAPVMAIAGGASAQELRVGISAELSAMDPHYHNVSPNNMLARHIYQPLVGQDEKQTLTPLLAESWKAIDDTTWEFKLRKNVKFHDGSPFTADDVIATMQRAPNVPKSPSSFSAYVRGKEFSKVDDFTIRVKTATPAPLVPTDLRPSASSRPSARTRPPRSSISANAPPVAPAPTSRPNMSRATASC